MQPKRHRPNQLICDINVAGFAGVMLALLWLLMPSPGDIDVHRWVLVDMPNAVHPVSMRGADREDAMIVAITRDDRIFFRTDRVAPDQLPAKIQQSLSQGSERKVYIRADARAKYGWVAEVLAGVRSAGVEKIGFLVDKRPTSPPNPQ